VGFLILAAVAVIVKTESQQATSDETAISLSNKWLLQESVGGANMLFLIASTVFAMLIGLSAVMVFGPDQLPLWIEGLFWGVIGAGMVARAVEISLNSDFRRGLTVIMI
jgi:hypothetical protein